MKIHGDYENAGYAHLEGLMPAAVAQQLLAQLKDSIDQSGVAQDMVRAAPPLKRPALELYAYEYLPLLSFLWGLTPTMCAVTRRALLPTYSYFRVYREGDVCRVHSDRTACEHSLSLTLAYSDGKPWAFEIGRARIEQAQSIADDFAESDVSSIVMQPGDAVLYQGVHYRHGRVSPNPNRWSAHMFLHWVDSAGPYRDQAFDGRASHAPVDFSFS